MSTVTVIAPAVLSRFPGAKLDRLECRHAWLDRRSLVMVGAHVTLGGEADAETSWRQRCPRKKLRPRRAPVACTRRPATATTICNWKEIRVESIVRLIAAALHC